MTVTDPEGALKAAILAIAPEADFDTLGPGEDMREALDLDSMDFLNVMIALHQATGIDIPEADYPQLFSFEQAVAYLRVRAQG